MFANWGGAVLKPSMLPKKNKHHIIAMFAGKEACVNQVCSKGRLCGLRCSPPDIFRVYHILNQVLTVSREWILEIAPIDSAMVW